MICPGLMLQCVMIATGLILAMMKIAASCLVLSTCTAYYSNALMAQPHQCFAQISQCSHALTDIMPESALSSVRHSSTDLVCYHLGRVCRALTLQTGPQGSVCPKAQAPKRRNGCSRSVGDLNLSAARLQSAARANLSRSADWPASSPACIRKRTVSLGMANCPQPAGAACVLWCLRVSCLCHASHDTGSTKQV